MADFATLKNESRDVYGVYIAHGGRECSDQHMRSRLFIYSPAGTMLILLFHTVPLTFKVEYWFCGVCPTLVSKLHDCNKSVGPTNNASIRLNGTDLCKDLAVFCTE